MLTTFVFWPLLSSKYNILVILLYRYPINNSNGCSLFHAALCWLEM